MCGSSRRSITSQWKSSTKKGGEGDVRDHSEPEAGATLTGRQPSGEPFPEDEDHLARRYPKLWQRFGAKPLG
jgi:hypothetical protein